MHNSLDWDGAGRATPARRALVEARASGCAPATAALATVEKRLDLAAGAARADARASLAALMAERVAIIVQSRIPMDVELIKEDQMGQREKSCTSPTAQGKVARPKFRCHPHWSSASTRVAEEIFSPLSARAPALSADSRARAQPTDSRQLASL